jgi:hypothetical protein
MPKQANQLMHFKYFLRQLCSRMSQKSAYKPTYKKSFLLLVGFYLMYLSKSALGINISNKYTAPRFFKVPLETVDCVFKTEIKFCPKSKQKLSLDKRQISQLNLD